MRIRIAAVLTLLCLCLAPLSIRAEMSQEAYLKSLPSATRVVTVLGKNYLLFAQNSPEWEEMRMDADGREDRVFGQAGCAVSAFANATVNALPYARLRTVLGVMLGPAYVDKYNLTLYHNLRKGRFAIESDADFLRYWPLVLGNLSSGNNTFRFNTSRSPGFYTRVLDQLGLRYEINTDFAKTIAALRQGALAITCSSGNDSPFSQVGHFFTLAGADEEYFYILDSYQRDRFPRDRRHAIEVLETGVERIRIADAPRVQIETQYVIWPDPEAEAYTEERLREIIAQSNAQL